MRESECNMQAPERKVLHRNMKMQVTAFKCARALNHYSELSHNVQGHASTCARAAQHAMCNKKPIPNHTLNLTKECWRSANKPGAQPTLWVQITTLKTSPQSNRVQVNHSTHERQVR
jgi:hypothetical protein